MFVGHLAVALVAKRAAPTVNLGWLMAGVTALEHPRLGLVGPVPLRRTGGHTGRYGMAYVLAPGLDPGDRGVRSAFDVAPTIVDLLGARPAGPMSGSSLL